MTSPPGPQRGGWAAPPPGSPGGPPQPGFQTGPPSGYYFAPPQPQASRGSPGAIIGAFVGILLLIALAVAAIVLLSQPPPPIAPCDPGVPCAPQPSLRPVADATPRASNLAPGPTPTPTPATSAPNQSPPASTPPGSPGASPFVPVATPTSDSPAVVSGAFWKSDAMAYSFEFNGEHFSLNSTGDDIAVLNGIDFDAQIRVHAAPASVSPAELIESELALVDRFVLGRAPDTDEYDALLGPSIGYLSGEGAVYSGTLVGSDGTPIEPVGVTILASSDGRITVVVTVIAGQPDVRLGSDTHQHAVRQSADHILKTFDWDTNS